MRKIKIDISHDEWWIATPTKATKFSRVDNVFAVPVEMWKAYETAESEWTKRRLEIVAYCEEQDHDNG